MREYESGLRDNATQTEVKCKHGRNKSAAGGTWVHHVVLLRKREKLLY